MIGSLASRIHRLTTTGFSMSLSTRWGNMPLTKITIPYSQGYAQVYSFGYDVLAPKPIRTEQPYKKTAVVPNLHSRTLQDFSLQNIRAAGFEGREPSDVHINY